MPLYKNLQSIKFFKHAKQIITLVFCLSVIPIYPALPFQTGAYCVIFSSSPKDSWYAPEINSIRNFTFTYNNKCTSTIPIVELNIAEDLSSGKFSQWNVISSEAKLLNVNAGQTGTIQISLTYEKFSQVKQKLYLRVVESYPDISTTNSTIQFTDFPAMKIPKPSASSKPTSKTKSSFKSPTPSPVPKKTSSGLRPCTSTEEANLINLLSQGISIRTLLGTYNQYLEKTQVDLRNAEVANQYYTVERLKIDEASWTAKIETLNKRLEALIVSEKSILSTCKRKSSEIAQNTATPQKIAPCSSSEVSRLNLLVQNFYDKKESLEATNATIEKLKSAYSFAISSGKNAATYMVEIEKYQRIAANFSTSANLIKREFEALKGGCSGYAVTLP
jgi:hypothetical protein